MFSFFDPCDKLFVVSCNFPLFQNWIQIQTLKSDILYQCNLSICQFIIPLNQNFITNWYLTNIAEENLISHLKLAALLFHVVKE